MTNVLLGGAIGDALGVFAESKPNTYEPLLAWDGQTYLGSQSHGLEPGQWTDDTQFSLAIAQSLIEYQEFNPEDLANRYVELFTSNSIRGYGKTTLAAIQNLQAGKKYHESGIVGTYGNGTAMRAAPFGVFYRNDLKTLIEVVKIDSAITHVSEDAEAGALAVAISAFYAANGETDDLLSKLIPSLSDSKIKRTLSGLDALVASNIAPLAALKILGTKANVCETVPSALYCFLKFDNYQEGVIAAIRAGLDTDTTASIVGALFAAKNGKQDIPQAWIEGVEDKDYLLELDRKLNGK